MRMLSFYLIGLVFGVGISLSGMANPAKVLNFFDIAGAWDPSLAFVMGGALVVTGLGYRLALRRATPVLALRFQVPSRTGLDPSLLSGAAIFGVGWGIAGFCPGGALPALGTGRVEVAVFVAALITGILLTRLTLDRRAGPRGLAPGSR
ncbi:DUF6691 family protein [Dinoroseobacter sp. S124A]|uniref:DUF6691 family protein n=1 Tax=Dinoroseobacter sp. S124A TaxID=3415128 RepID=UPI003C7991B5